MYIRDYKPDDCLEIINLFYETVHSVNKKDYKKSQLIAWANKDNIDIKRWNKSFLKNFTLVAYENEVLIGFGDINKLGYLDRLYVHKDYQGKGVASKIVSNLENYIENIGITKITTHASITAKKFFQNKGYRVLLAQEVNRGNEVLKNFIMEKKL